VVVGDLEEDFDYSFEFFYFLISLRSYNGCYTLSQLFLLSVLGMSGNNLLQKANLAVAFISGSHEVGQVPPHKEVFLLFLQRLKTALLAVCDWHGSSD